LGGRRNRGVKDPQTWLQCTLRVGKKCQRLDRNLRDLGGGIRRMRQSALGPGTSHAPTVRKLLPPGFVESHVANGVVQRDEVPARVRGRAHVASALHVLFGALERRKRLRGMLHGARIVWAPQQMDPQRMQSRAEHAPPAPQGRHVGEQRGRRDQDILSFE
jgi:hypothetical protein